MYMSMYLGWRRASEQGARGRVRVVASLLAFVGMKYKALRRHIVTAGMDELKTAAFKATADDSLPPKEKHVRTLLAAASSEAVTARQVDVELARRLQGSRSVATSAKALVIVHRLALDVGVTADAFPECARALTAAVGGATAPAQAAAPPPEPAEQASFVAGCAAYLCMLLGWGGVSDLRDTDAAARRTSHAAPLRDVLAELPRLQQLLSAALDCCAAGGGSGGGVPMTTPLASLQALRLCIVSDAFNLLHLEHASAGRLQMGLLSLPPSLVGAQPGGYLEALEGACVHARRALALRCALDSEAGRPSPFSDGIREVVGTVALWPRPGAGLALPPMPAPALPPSTDSLGGALGSAAIGCAGGGGGAPSLATSATASTAIAWDATAAADERAALLRGLLESLPPPSLSAFCERTLGLSVTRVSQLDADQLRAIDTSEAVYAARLVRRRHAHIASTPVRGGAASGAASGAARRADLRAVAAVGRVDSLSISRHASVHDPQALREATSLINSRSPSLANRRLTCSPLAAGSVGGDGMALPPLPVPLAALSPSLPFELSPPQLSLAAYELLLSATDGLGAGVRVSLVGAQSAAAHAGLQSGDVLFTCNGTLLLGARQAGAVLRSAADECAAGGRARLQLVDGREKLLLGGSAAPAPPPAARRAGGDGASRDAASAAAAAAAAPFGLVHAPLRRASDADTAAAELARCQEELLELIRTRMGIPLRQHRWILPLLRTPLASDPPPSDPPPPTTPAYRGLVLMHAGRSAGGGAAGGAVRYDPRTNEVGPFVTRQVGLLRNAVVSSWGAGADPTRSEALRRLESQAVRLLTLRFTRPASVADDASVGERPEEQRREQRREEVALAATLREIGALTGGGDGDGGSDGSAGSVGGGGGGAGGSRLRERSSEPATAAAGGFGQGARSPTEGVERPMALLSRWPSLIGFKLYSCLLDGVWEDDEPDTPASNCATVVALLRATVWHPCGIDEPRHSLAMLAVAFERYQV